MEDFVEKFNHNFPTDLINRNGKNPKVSCENEMESAGTGYVSNCNYDIAKNFLEHLYDIEDLTHNYNYQNDGTLYAMD